MSDENFEFLITAILLYAFMVALTVILTGPVQDQMAVALLGVCIVTVWRMIEMSETNYKGEKYQFVKDQLYTASLMLLVVGVFFYVIGSLVVGLSYVNEALDPLKVLLLGIAAIFGGYIGSLEVKKIEDIPQIFVCALTLPLACCSLCGCLRFLKTFNGYGLLLLIGCGLVISLLFLIDGYRNRKVQET